jgi:hypothetical protein
VQLCFAGEGGETSDLVRHVSIVSGIAEDDTHVDGCLGHGCGGSGSGLRWSLIIIYMDVGNSVQRV